MLVKSYSNFVQLKDKELISVTSFRHPIQRAFFLNERGVLAYVNPKYAMMRSQDLQAHFHDAGMFYWYHTEPYIKQVTLDKVPFHIARNKAEDIDTEEDFQVAQKYFLLQDFRSMQQTEKKNALGWLFTFMSIFLFISIACKIFTIKSPIFSAPFLSTKLQGFFADTAE